MPWHDLVRKYLDPAEDLCGRRVLEIGCGRGEFARWLAGSGNAPASIAAADFSPAAIQIARQVGGRGGFPSITWEVADIQAIPHPDASFDTVISCETIEHVPDPAKAVRELVRVLKPGGRLFLTTPNYLGTFGLYRGYLRLVGRPWTEAGQPINRFVMLPRTARWVRAAGAEVEAVDSVGHYVLLPGRHPIRLERNLLPSFISKWFGLQSCVVARKT